MGKKNNDIAVAALTVLGPDYCTPNALVMATYGQISGAKIAENKNNRGAQQTASSPSPPYLHRNNDEEKCMPPNALWGVICDTGNGNVKEACKALAWDMVDSGLQVRWKDHQSADSSIQVLLMNSNSTNDDN